MKNSERTETRKSQILDVAENLFYEKGYEHTTINDIINASGIAKGSLYYHYKSKEDVLDGIVKRRGDKNIEAAMAIAQKSSITAQAKLLQAILSQKPENEREKQLTDDYEKSSNGQMFLKSLTDIISRLAPVIKGIVEQGIQEGIFSTPYPLESIEILLSAAHALFDNSELKWTMQEQAKKTAAFILSVERTLGAKEGSLSELAQSILRDRGE
jgi:AcrR family transcriptional regulator